MASDKSVIRLFFLICALFFVPPACAIEISAPPDIFLQNTAGTPNCTAFDVSVYGSDALLLQSAWSANPSRNLEDYFFSARDVGLIVEHPEIVWVNAGSFSIPFCVVSKESGIYRGVLLMQPAQSIGGIGTWIVVNVSENALRNNGLLESVRAESGTSILRLDMPVIINLAMMFFLLCGLIAFIAVHHNKSIDFMTSS